MTAALPAIIPECEESAERVDPVVSARQAGLRYVSDLDPGIRRQRRGRGFAYVRPDGRIEQDREVRRRIRSLAIPPAWTDVWICLLPEGHLQATGRDARGRKQYRYHPRWRAVRDETKYTRLIAFGRALPALREHIDADLGLPGLPREKVLAAVVRLLEETRIRIGNEEYARANDSFGLTTLRDDHAAISGSVVRFSFRGKGRKEHTITLRDRRLARVVHRCQDLPGQVLFQYLDPDGEARTVGSADVNAYIRGITEQDFTAKDFRTWAGTVLAATALAEAGPCSSQSTAKRQLAEAMRCTAARLGNTPAICRKCYVHPEIIASYLDGSLPDAMSSASGAREIPGLSAEEARVLRLLETRAPR